MKFVMLALWCCPSVAQVADLNERLASLSLQPAEPYKWKDAMDRAERLHQEGRLTEVRTILFRALENASRHQNGEYRLAYTFNSLGSVAQDQGHYFEAEKYYRRAIACWPDGGDGSLVGLARTLNNLASLLDSAGKLGEVEGLLRRSEAILIEHLGAHDPEIGVLLLHRGTVHFRQRRYGEAESAYRRAWAVMEPHRHSQELKLARIANDLGLACEKTGRKEEADSHYAFARTVWEKHVQSGKATLEVYTNLARLYLFLRQDLPAKLMLQAGLPIAERELGSGHPRFGDMLLLYARVLHQTGNKAEAGRIAKQAAAIRSQSQERLARHTIAVSDLVREEQAK